jgi:predicted ATP-grasp superfamily ATP-dependent carboligase
MEGIYQFQMYTEVAMTEFRKDVIKKQLRDRNERENMKFRESMKRVFGSSIFEENTNKPLTDKNTRV